LIWKVIKDIILLIHDTIKLPDSGYICIKTNGENKIINNNKSSKNIYQYDIKNNIITQHTKIPEKYYKIISLDIHPTKNQIAFTYSIPDSDDPVEREFEVLDFDSLAIYDIDEKIEIFQETEKGHFFYKVSYFIDEKDIYLVIYDRDGAGMQFQPLIKRWKEISQNKFILDYIYDSYPKEKNIYLYNLKIVKNKIFFYNSTYSQISKIEHLDEKLFYKLDKNYVINDIY